MTSQGAYGGASGWTARQWTALRQLSDRTSLRTKLITALLALVAAAVAAVSISSVWVLGSYLTSQDDAQLQPAFDGVVNNFSAIVSNRPIVPGEMNWVQGESNVRVWVQQPGTPLSGVPNGLPYGGTVPSQSVPAVPTSVLWADTNKAKLLTVPAQSGSDVWRVMTYPVSYQLINSATGSTEQVNGTLIVGVDLGNINATIGRLAVADLVIGSIIVCVLALAIVVVVRSSLRPLVDIEETAGEIAAGHLNRRVPERDERTEIGSLGRSLNTMLSQIETAFHTREESEAAAHQNEERMRRFIADASHELRTPLTAIRGFAEYYRQRGGVVEHGALAEAGGAGSAAGGTTAGGTTAGGTTAGGTTAGGTTAGGTTATGLTPEDLDRIMERVEKEAARMGLLVEDLLLLARLDQQRPLARQPVDLLSLAADAVHDARLLAPDRAIDLSVAPGAAFLVIGDEARLRQVIGNLMSNALTHTPAGTPIEVSIGSGVLDSRKSDSAPAVILDVTDHGPGMPSDQAHRVFERFYRADRARARATGGSGLGLAIVAALVAAQGGVASVRTSEGKGATFRITLPLAPEAQHSHEPDDDSGDTGAQADLGAQGSLSDEPDVISDADAVSRGN
jgi:two-component system, OmpR family, sensor kinase